MTKAPPGFTRTLLSIAVPVTLQNLLASSFTLIDTMMIGKLGDTPLAAVGMAGKWTWFLTIVFFGFSSGASVFISQFYGAGDDAGMRRTYGLMTVGTQAAALLFMLAALLFPDGIVRLFSSDEQAIALGASYLRIIALSYPFLALTRGGGTLLQSTGDVMIPFVGSLISVAVNITLNALLIFGLCGFPALGVQGAAIATVIGQLIGAAAALWFNRVKNPVIHVRLKGYRFLWQDVADIYRVGLPTIVMQAIGSVMTFAVNGILLGVSSTAVAFFGIYYKLQNFLMMPVNGLGQAAIPVVGFNYGSGQSDRVKQAWKVLLPTGVVFALCGTAVFLLFPAQLLGLFSASDEMLAFGVPALRIISVTFLFAVITILCGYFASGLGNGVVNMIGGALRQLVVLVPCLWLLIRTMGIDRAWFAFWVSEVIACAYSLWATKKELRNKGK